jgi:hypothetical protein
MAKYSNPLFLDAALDYLSTNGTRYDICSAQPANYAGIAAVTLGTTTLVGGDYTKANGDVSGRKVTVAAKNGISITATGTANHVAISNGSNNLIYVTTLASNQSVTSGNTADIASFKVEIENPV